MSDTTTRSTAPQSTVLVATDADHVHDEVAAALGGDHRVVRVHAGAEVLAAVTTHRPVLVVLDLQIGNMGGMAACLDLRLEQRADRIPVQRIVMLLDRDADAFLAHRAEADAWVVKPVDALMLRQTAREALAA
ncbi:MAG: response regulator [Actinomycetota bacterium]|nr:response regulator [Actinomycetota bacterium]MEC9057370.1 response regulator [Actinomycetota bacterium]MED5233453.1 response regulator [Actinomycetota bacterium]MED5393069.1 response regulator [Actinomycetota bacterium]MED5397639.1 response regulator [Actinomycetota bacterium]